MAKNDLVWTDGIRDTWGDSAFIANGLTGASIYRLPGDDWVLRWELGRTDVAAEHRIPGIDWSIPRVPIGNIVLQPVGEVKHSDMRLDIWNAEARGDDLTAFPDVIDTIVSPNETDTFTDSTPPSGKRFYRVEAAGRVELRCIRRFSLSAGLTEPQSAAGCRGFCPPVAVVPS